MPRNFFWPGLLFVLTFLMLIFVPRERITRLLPLGLIAGFGGGIALLSLLVRFLGYWGFNYPGVFSVSGFSLWAALAWTPVVIIFVHFLYHPDTRQGLYGYVFAFALTTAFFVQWLGSIGHLTFRGWNIWMTFLAALILYGLTAYAAFRTGMVRDRSLEWRED
jgi:hypothetical protein